MRVSTLELADFRNHEHLVLSFPEGTTTIIGRNGRGKTNIIEAVNYLATLGSHRVSSDQPLIRHGRDAARIEAMLERGGRRATAAVTITSSGSNKAVLNGAPLRRPRDLLGVVHAVVFAPEDLELVKGDPASRRRYVDELATQLAPRVAGLRAEFDRVLRQRGALLKSAGRRPLNETARSTLDVWDEQFVVHGSALVYERLAALDRIAPWVGEHGRMISGGTEPLTAEYTAKWLEPSTRSAADIATQLSVALTQRRDDELDRGMCLVGPHRDDVALTLSGAPAKGYASHGQSWSVALALRLSAFSVLREIDDDPVLILDDVFAELDARRRERLLSAVRGTEQTLITAAVEQDVPDELLAHIVPLQD